MTQLLINADDFGLHPAINSAIAEGVDAGVINSLSVSVVGSDVDKALLQELSSKGVYTGLHLTWVGENWLTNDIKINSWRNFLYEYFMLTRTLLNMMKTEAMAQLEAYNELGIPLDHIDGHQHLHVFPGMGKFIIDMAKANGNCRVRIPATPHSSLRRTGLGGMALQRISQNLLPKVDNPFYCIGIKNSGHYDAATLIRELNTAGEERLEIVAHPGADNKQLTAKYPDWGFDWEKEHAAFLSPEFKDAISENYQLLKKSP